MSCDLLIANFAKNPILIGFPWKGGLSFGTGTTADFVAVNYSLYDIFFAISPSSTSSIIATPTATVLGDWVIFEFTDEQTVEMTAGEWAGHSFLQLKTNGSPQFVTKLEICIINPVPTP